MDAHDERMVGWIAAYALGATWAGLSREEARHEIVGAADGDRQVIAAALRVVGIVDCDDVARRRAVTVLQEVLGSLSPKVRPGDRRTVAAGALPAW